MSNHKHIERICCAIIILTLFVTVIFVNGEKLGIAKEERSVLYENRLFSTDQVHTIDLVIDIKKWEEFLETAQKEEYMTCSVIIDGESYKNVAIRAKGNTSLSQVASYENDRYSFKIEFDHYDSGKSYYGLDKLVLNNLIQDNSYMKDYLTYQMMNEMGVNAPLSSFAYLTVNGEDWGLYLALEAVEDSFLERNYGSDKSGELYKPDSMSMGGGHGNGMDFNMDDIEDRLQSGEFELPEGMKLPEGMELPEGMKPSEETELPDSAESSGETKPQEGMELPEETAKLEETEKSKETEQQEGAEKSEEKEQIEGTENTAKPEETERTGMEQPEGIASQETANNRRGNGFTGTMPGGMRGRNGSSDVSLIYTDDEYSSYTNIFENAKTEVTNADKDRLIASIKQLNEGTDLEEVVDVEQVLKYFAVHNFVVNFDSYTGSMIHNYYLYEEDGVMSMIPWDYNLAFGTFGMGGAGGTSTEATKGATAMVNYPIDTPVSGGELTSRPMIGQLLNKEEYMELYHEYLTEFMEDYFQSGKFEELFDQTVALISPYVEKDPTAFCTYEEFLTGVSALKEFCSLRAQSVTGQLNGEIPSTSDGQEKDSSTLVDASHIELSDMGSMGGNRMNGFGMEAENGSEQVPSETNEAANDSKQKPSEANEPARQAMEQNSNGRPFEAGSNRFPDSMTGDTAAVFNRNIFIVIVSAAFLIIGIVFAILFKRRKKM